MTNLLLVDDKIGTVGPSGASNCPPSNTMLGPGQSIMCTATGVAQAGQYSNTATVTGSTPVGLVQPPKSATAQDISHYFGVTPDLTPGLTIVKLTNGNPATNPNDPDVPVIAPGAMVTWTYRVTNSGDVPFAEGEIKVTDNLIGPITQIIDRGNGDATLDPSETWVFQAVGTAVNLAEGQTTLTVVPGCDPNQTGQIRPTYENIGTATVRGLSTSAPSHYCNPLAMEGALGDYVWHDRNANGLQDEGPEQGIADVPVKLFTGNDQLVATTTTNAQGYYHFLDVTPGQYYLEFSLPTGFASFSPAQQGGDKEKDSDVTTLNGQSGRTPLFTFAGNGMNDFSWDAGLYQSAGVGDFVWFDTNHDGIQQPDEQAMHGVADIKVELYQMADSQETAGTHGNSTLVQTTQTNAKGLYQFTKLAPGKYYLHFVLTGSSNVIKMSLVGANRGNDRTLDSDPAVNTGETAIFTLQSGQYDDTWDAGVVVPEAEPEAPEPLQTKVFLPVVVR